MAETEPTVEVVGGVERLEPGLGRLFVVIGVFDGLHLGHAYLLERLVEEARARAALPTVITFDHHPDEVLVGAAPPLLCDPSERLARLAEAGVEVVVVQPFDDTVRRTPYDVFVRSIADRVDLAGFLMTPEAAFGHERRGTPESVASLGREVGYDVVVAPQLTVDGAPVTSSEIRRRIAAGDLAGAAALLGRPYAVVGDVASDGWVAFAMPVALPGPGHYPVDLDGRLGILEIDTEGCRIEDADAIGPHRITFA